MMIRETPFIPTIAVLIVPFMIPVFKMNYSIDLLLISSEIKDAVNVYASSNTRSPTISEDS